MADLYDLTNVWSPGTTIFFKRNSKLDFLKAVSVTMTANSE